MSGKRAFSPINIRTGVNAWQSAFLVHMPGGMLWMKQGNYSLVLSYALPYHSKSFPLHSQRVTALDNTLSIPPLPMQPVPYEVRASGPPLHISGSAFLHELISLRPLRTQPSGLCIGPTAISRQPIPPRSLLRSCTSNMPRVAMTMHAAAARRPVAPARQHPHVPTQQLCQHTAASPPAPTLHAAGASNIVPAPVLAAAVAAESLAQASAPEAAPLAEHLALPAAAGPPAADSQPVGDRERVHHLLLSWDRYM